MDGSIPKITESLAVPRIPQQRERRPREGAAKFEVPLGPSSEDEAPRDIEVRPVAAPEEGEPGTRLDLRG